MKTIDYEDRMEIVQQMLYWAYTRGIDQISDLSKLYIGHGYSPLQIYVIEQAAKNIFKRLFPEMIEPEN